MSNATKKLTEADLSQFTGSETFTRHWSRRLIFTEGVKFLAENAASGSGAYWLIDAIASHQIEIKTLANKRDRDDLRDFQVWELKLNGKGGATLTCRADSDRKPAVTQEIEFTDFEFDIKLWVERGEEMTLMLPSER